MLGDGHEFKFAVRCASIMNATSAASLPMADIDYSKFFIPEEMTPLFFTAVYRDLSRDQKLRFNQLYTSSFHEQFMNLEKVLVSHLIPALIARFADDPLVEPLHVFRDEEIEHTRMFHELHTRCEPHLYRNREFFFVRMPSWMQVVLGFVSSRPALFPFCIWLTIVEEERTIYYSKRILRRADELEPAVVDIHRRHIADEVGHVRWDEELLDRLWPERSLLFRSVNARLFAFVLCEYFNMPKRAGARVIEQWMSECPELRPLAPVVHRQFRALERDRAYLLTLYARDMAPRSFALLDQWPEFGFLSRMLPGYVANC